MPLKGFSELLKTIPANTHEQERTDDYLKSRIIESRMNLKSTLNTKTQKSIVQKIVARIRNGERRSDCPSGGNRHPSTNDNRRSFLKKTPWAEGDERG